MLLIAILLILISAEQGSTPQLLQLSEMDNLAPSNPDSFLA